MNITEIRPGDVIFAQIPLGNLPNSKASQQIEKIRDEFKKFFDNNMVLVGTRETEYTFEILRK